MAEQQTTTGPASEKGKVTALVRRDAEGNVGGSVVLPIYVPTLVDSGAIEICTIDVPLAPSRGYAPSSFVTNLTGGRAEKLRRVLVALQHLGVPVNSSEDVIHWMLNQMIKTRDEAERAAEAAGDADAMALLRALRPDRE